jgi:hypothetical protein
MYAPNAIGRREMTVAALIDMLEDLRSEYGDTAIVRLMTQESWPFENRVAGVAVSTEFGNDDEDAECYPTERLTEDGEVPVCVYLVEGDQAGYGDRDAWSNLRRNA